MFLYNSLSKYHHPVYALPTIYKERELFLLSSFAEKGKHRFDIVLDDAVCDA